MADIIALRFGPFPVISTFIVLGLLAADARYVAAIHRHMYNERPSEKPGYAFGLAIGLWSRTTLVAAAGVFTIFGSLVGFALFAIGTIWRAIPPARDFMAGFLQGYAESSGRSSPALASAFGAGWVAITRGIPLVFLYAILPAT